MATNVGRIGIVSKGDWSSSATYETLDAVSYNGGTYIAKQAVPANTLPTNTTYWQVGLAQRGAILSKAVGNEGWTVPLVVGTIIAYARKTSNKSGLAIVDYQNNITEFVSMNGASITISDNQLSVACSTAGIVTLIIPYYS